MDHAGLRIRCIGVLRASAVVLAVALLSTGCRESSPKEEPSELNIDDLRSLPYLGGTAVDGEEESGVVIYDDERSCPGYSLYSVAELSRLELIDSQGEVIRTWQHQPSRSFSNAEILPNGDVLVVGAEEGTLQGRPFPGFLDEKRYLVRFNWAGELLWKKRLRAHHDVELTPDGKILVLTFSRRNLARFHNQIPVRDDELTWLNQSGEVLRSLSMLDAIGRNPSAYPLQPIKPSGLGGPPWIDLFHANSVETMYRPALFSKNPMYSPDNVLVCFRHQDCIAVFDARDTKAVWSWGKGVISGPHDANMLENGNILLFDNGLARGFSRAIELDPLREEIVWEYRADPPESFYTASKGSAQRLPNGNTLLAESDAGRAFEVTAEGEVVWEFRCPHEIAPGKRAALVRIKRYSVEFIEKIIAEQR